MTSTAALVLLLALALIGGSSPARAAPQRPTRAPRPPRTPPPIKPVVTESVAVKAPATTPPWPQVVPATVPSFPGGEWVPDVPVGPGVAARASQLLSVLWARGKGASQTEQTAGRWITYVAAMTGDKRGVVAYRLADEQGRIPAGRAPAAIAVVSPVPAPGPVYTSEPASTTALRSLSLGSSGKDVEQLQARLGVWAKGGGVTGYFGDMTKSAVQKFQREQGLAPSGVVDNATWTKLFAVRSA